MITYNFNFHKGDNLENGQTNAYTKLSQTLERNENMPSEKIKKISSLLKDFAEKLKHIPEQMDNNNPRDVHNAEELIEKLSPMLECLQVPNVMGKKTTKKDKRIAI